MGTVHGVYLKYVGLSAISFASLAYLATGPDGSRVTVAELLRQSVDILTKATIPEAASSRALPALALCYATIVNGAIAVLFKSEFGVGLIGKDRTTGSIPPWSYLLFFPFHIPTRLYTYVHSKHDKTKKNEDGSPKVPVATEVQPGWWVGGCYGHELEKQWAAVIDLTVEFPETNETTAYLSMPTWDGVPASPAQLDEAATFAAAHSAKGDILVHCAHGRGRSTTVMCACLVKAGLFATWEEAFEEGIKPQRSVCKLNRRMRQNLTEWQATYVTPLKDDSENKKGQ